MKKHTKAALIVSSIDATKIVTAGARVRLLVAQCPATGTMSHTERMDNAARLVACWNACEGIDDPSIFKELLAITGALARRLDGISPDGRYAKVIARSRKLISMSGGRE